MADSERVMVPPDVEWRMNITKLDDGSFIFTVQTPNAGLSLHLNSKQLRDLAANAYQQSSGLHIPSNGHKDTP